MLSLRRSKGLNITLFTALAVLSICVVTGYADHVAQSNGKLWDDQVLWQIATGKHEWNNTDTYSYHYMYVENNLNTWVKLTYQWKHEFKEGSVLLQSDKVGNEGRPRRINSGDTYSTEGWLNTYTAGGIPDGSYNIKSTTEISIENGHGFSEELPPISKTTHFTVGE